MPDDEEPEYDHKAECIGCGGSLYFTNETWDLWKTFGHVMCDTCGEHVPHPDKDKSDA